MEKWFRWSLAIAISVYLTVVTVSAMAAESFHGDELEAILLGCVDLLNTNVVSSTKTEEKLFESPSIMYVITEEQINQRGYTTVADVLKDVPGFDIEDTQGGWVNQYWRLRGTRGVREMLLIVDGVVQNNTNDFEAGRLHNFKLALVDRVEIVTGPASALYGANALLGVINVISKNPAKMNKVEISHAYTTSGGNKFGEFDKNNSTLRYANVIGQDTAFALAVNRVKNNDIGKDYYDPIGGYKKGTFDPIYGPEAGPIADDGFDSHQDDISVNLRIARGDNSSFGVDYGDFDEGIGAMLSSARYFLNKDAKWHTRRL
ncbi:MAG: TonB-dependent receptor plug domain-containing protein, partial [Elusimicrobia bacterium]|nr:TonB-dependent receptor plug domain-containing protein [Elusimicrobiota bacterium]